MVPEQGAATSPNDEGRLRDRRVKAQMHLRGDEPAMRYQEGPNNQSGREARMHADVKQGETATPYVVSVTIRRCCSMSEGTPSHSRSS